MEPVVAAAAANAGDVDQQARFPREAIEALSDAGLLGVTIPKRLGGLGGDASDVAALVTAVAGGCASTGMILTMHIAACAALLTEDTQFESVLRAAAAGEHLATLALSERATRSNFWISMGGCERRGTGWRIEVDKSFVTSAGPANSYVVSTATPGRSSVNELELLHVGVGQSGVEVLDWWQGSGLRGNSSAPMRFRCDLGDEAHIGPPGQGQQVLLEHVVPWFQLGAAAVSVGICRTAAETTREHVVNTQLEHLGERLVDQPVVRHNLGRLIAGADSIDGFVTAVAAEMASGTAQLHRILELKALANEAALTTTDMAMRLGGGAAYSGRNAMDRLFRDARAGVVMAPTADMLFDMVGRVASGMPPI